MRVLKGTSLVSYSARGRHDGFSPIHLVHRGDGHSGCVTVDKYSLSSGSSSAFQEFFTSTLCSCWHAKRFQNVQSRAFCLLPWR